MDLANQSSGSKMPRADWGVVEKGTFSFPTFPEQQKISRFLSLLDSRIATQNKIIDSLETLIKGLSESLFNQKLRFKDEQENDFPDWRIRKLGEVFTFKVTNSYSRDKLNYHEGYVKNIHYGDIHTKYRTLLNLQNDSAPYINSDVNISKIEGANYCKVGDLIVADASEDLKDVGKSVEVVNLNGQKVLAGLHTILARPLRNIFSIGFCGYLFKSEKIRQQIQKEAQGSKVLSISTTRLSNVLLDIPALEEQTKIALSLSVLSDKIKTEKSTLRKYQQQRVYLLKKLFI
jgi:type I restriction enzyme S subunit